MTSLLKPHYRLTTRIWAYLQLMRPANIVTAWADIFTGFVASGTAIDVSLA